MWIWKNSHGLFPVLAAQGLIYLGANPAVL